MGEKLRESWAALLKLAAFRGDLCFAPSAGQNVRFVRPDQWLGAWRAVETDEAIRDVVRRYLSVYGPATRDEFARWFGLTSPAQAERLITRLGDEVVQVDVDGTRAWLPADWVAELAASSPSGTVNLLPAFDQYVVAAPRDSPSVIPDGFKQRVYRAQGWLSPVLLVDGRVAGVWRHERRGDRLSVAIEPFAPLPTEVER